MSVLAVLAASAAAVLLLPVRGVVPRAPPRPIGRRALLLVVVVGGPVLLLVGGGSVRLVFLAAIGAGAGVGGARLLRTRAERHRAVATAALVLQACETLAAELGAGRPPGASLELAADEWSDLAPVAAAFRVGADVPQAWRAAAAEPGARDLRVVAAAWQVAQRTGAGLAEVLDQVARDLRAARTTRRVVDGELASARATARLVAALPLLALTMGSSAGSDPWGFLLGHPVGLGCLALGLGFALAGLSWIEALAREVDRP